MQGDQSYQADVSLSQFLSPEPPPVPRVSNFDIYEIGKKVG